MEIKRDTIFWWVRYLEYCKKNNINSLEQTYQEYIETMDKVKKWVEQNDLLSQN